jgi:hypothetical protein
MPPSNVTAADAFDAPPLDVDDGPGGEDFGDLTVDAAEQQADSLDPTEESLVLMSPSIETAAISLDRAPDSQSEAHANSQAEAQAPSARRRRRRRRRGRGRPSASPGAPAVAGPETAPPTDATDEQADQDSNSDEPGE